MARIFKAPGGGTNYVRPLYGLQGRFSLSGRTNVPYCLHAVSLDRVVDELKTMEEMTPSLNTRWTLEELFQREIDQKRVREQIVNGYLLDQRKLKFFNALVVVLMPIAGNGDNQIQDRFPPRGSSPPLPYDGQCPADKLWQDHGAVDKSFGGVQYHVLEDQSRLRWDRCSTAAMVVDGQHRLESLRRYKTVRGGFSAEDLNTTIPVMFVLLDAQAGFQPTSDTDDWTIQQIARELFTFLNKHAEKVDKARELILDDGSIVARCVRTLVTPDAPFDDPAPASVAADAGASGAGQVEASAPVPQAIPVGTAAASAGDNDMQGSSPDGIAAASPSEQDTNPAPATTANPTQRRLPLTLVRWQEENSRFDQDYFINSLTNLESLVADILDLKEPSNPLDSTEVEEFLRSIEISLSIGQELLDARTGESLNAHFKNIYFDDDGELVRPFSQLPSGFLDSAVDGFRKHHGTWVLAMLTQFAPYADILSYARTHNLIQGTFGQYFAQTAAHRTLLKESQELIAPGWHAKNIESHIARIKQMKGSTTDNADLSFKTVFQKAIMRLGKLLGFEMTGSQSLGSIDTLLSVLNKLHRKGVFSTGQEVSGQNHKYLWTFIALNAGTGKISVRQKTVDQIDALVSIWYYANRKIDEDAAKAVPELHTSRELVLYFKKKSNIARWPACADHIQTLTDALDVGAFFEREVAETTKKKRIENRLVALLTEGVLGTLRPEGSGNDDGSSLEDAAAEVITDVSFSEGDAAGGAASRLP